MTTKENLVDMTNYKVTLETTYTVVIFGISGDISNKKVIPGLYELFTESKNTISQIIGYGRTKFTEKSYNDMIKYNKNINNPSDEFLNLFSYISGQYNELEGYKKIYI